MGVDLTWTGSLAMLVWRPVVGAWTLTLLLLCTAGVAHRAWKILLGRTGAWRAAVLLGLRVCVLSGLLLLLLDPGCERRMQRKERLDLVLVADRSGSMEVFDRGGSAASRHGRAVLLAERIAQQAPEGVRVLRHVAGTNLVEVERWPEAPDRSGLSEPPVPEGTDLAAVLLQLAEDPRARATAAVVLLTDGGDAMIEPARLPESPMLVLGIGSDPESWRDLAIESVQAPERVELGARIPVEVALRAYSAGDPEFAAQLGNVGVFLEEQRDGQWVLHDQTRTDVGTGGASVNFDVRAGQAGHSVWRVRTDPLRGELSTLNNQRQFSLRVVEESLRVLYYSRRIGADLKFLRQELSADPAVSFSSLVQTSGERFLLQGEAQSWEDLANVSGLPPDAVLQRFHCVVLGSFPAGDWTLAEMEALRSYVERGGGLVWVGGEDSFDAGYAASPLAELIPWRVSAAEGFLRATAVLLPTAEGRARWAGVWEEFADGTGNPEVQALNRAGTLKAGAVAWLEARMPQGTMPFLVEQPYGRGRVLAVASNTTWRWVLAGPPWDRVYRQLWRQTVRAASGQGEIEGELRVRLDRERVLPGMRVALEIDVLNATSQSGAAARAEGPAGVEIIGLERDAAVSGRWRGHAVFRSRGSHRLIIEALRDGLVVESFERTLLVEPEETEGSRLEVDHGELERLAAQGGGLYGREGRDDWTEWLAERLKPDVKVETVPLVSSGPFFLLGMLALMLLEWFLRRRSNLI